MFTLKPTTSKPYSSKVALDNEKKENVESKKKIPWAFHVCFPNKTEPESNQLADFAQLDGSLTVYAQIMQHSISVT